MKFCKAIAMLAVVAMPTGLSGGGLGAGIAGANELSGIQTCQPGRGSAQFSAPSDAARTPKPSSDPAIAASLLNRGTVNVAGPWLDTERHDISNYSLFWHSWNSRPAGSEGAIWLKELLWAYSHSERQTAQYWEELPGLASFRTGRNWPGEAEYGRPEVLAYNDPAFPDYLAAVAERMLAETGADGVLLDWWIDDHPLADEPTVRAARIAIAQGLRDRLGEDTILMGNVGRMRDKATAGLMNGAFMELWKMGPATGYSCDELGSFEGLLEFYDRHLRSPALIVFEPWRISNRANDADRDSLVNRRLAALFASMAAVVPENGYVLYSDNAKDTAASDHDHVLYDVYRQELGRATSGRTQVADGISYRRFERGLVIYNISNANAAVTFPEGVVNVRSVEGLICAVSETGFDCL